MTMDVYYAAIDGLDAVKEGLFAGKEGPFNANCESIGRIKGHLAAKRIYFERSRVIFAVIEGITQR